MQCLLQSGLVLLLALSVIFALLEVSGQTEAALIYVYTGVQSHRIYRPGGTGRVGRVQARPKIGDHV